MPDWATASVSISSPLMNAVVARALSRLCGPTMIDQVHLSLCGRDQDSKYQVSKCRQTGQLRTTAQRALKSAPGRMERMVTTFAG